VCVVLVSTPRNCRAALFLFYARPATQDTADPGGESDCIRAEESCRIPFFRSFGEIEAHRTTTTSRTTSSPITKTTPRSGSCTLGSVTTIRRWSGSRDSIYNANLSKPTLNLDQSMQAGQKRSRLASSASPTKDRRIDNDRSIGSQSIPRFRQTQPTASRSASAATRLITMRFGGTAHRAAHIRSGGS